MFSHMGLGLLRHLTSVFGRRTGEISECTETGVGLKIVAIVISYQVFNVHDHDEERTVSVGH